MKKLNKSKEQNEKVSKNNIMSSIFFVESWSLSLWKSMVNHKQVNTNGSTKCTAQIV